MGSQLARWFEENGRHDLPWRRTDDPWLVLVSELMLQQTPVARVLEPWQRFRRLWPTPAAMARADLGDVLREWKGLGYPRRARALWESARAITADGWPSTESGLRVLPGVGEYTARAVLCFAFTGAAVVPRDVNIARVAARAWLGVEGHEAKPSDLDIVIASKQPRDMDGRAFAFALFDIGAGLCTARAVRCTECPLQRTCRSKERLAAGGVPQRPRRQAAYEGSFRELRGAVLAATLEGRVSSSALRHQLGHLSQARESGAIERALDSLRRDGLIPPNPPSRNAARQSRPVSK